MTLPRLTARALAVLSATLSLLCGLPSDGQAQTVMQVTQYSYDADERLQCTAVRMDPTQWAGQTNACSPQTTSANGPDRITEKVYDAAGQLIQELHGVGTSIQEAYATYAYDPDGKPTDVIDANGNHTQYVYDGLERQIQWIFPSTTQATAFNASSQANALATANAPDATDYEAYAYDANGNRTSLRKRDGTVLNYKYDALNRVITKTVPQRSGLPATDARSVYYSYDLEGHQLTAWFDSATSGQGVASTYDALGRQVTTTLVMDGNTQTVSYQYDLNNNRTQVGFPDGNYVTYSYDGLDRPSQILRSGASPIASYAYNADGTRQSFSSNGSAVSTTYAYDPVDRLSGLTNTPANSNYSDQFGFNYNAASQITQSTQSNSTFAYNGTNSVTRPYSVNGLNQYISAGSANFTYDMNGNLTGDGTNTYLYDIENRLVVAGGGLNASLRYDPLGRLYEVVGANGTTRFLYGGDKLLAEYDGNGNLQRRYVHGADLKSDDPIAWYEGSAFTSAFERFLRPNWQGSIEVVTDTTGNTVYATNSYDEYGVPGAGNTGRFQYTGQLWVPELGMYYYKARTYSPALGRFLQTDPVGYKDNLDLYAYAGDDPLNHTDPTGLRCTDAGQGTVCQIDQVIDAVRDPSTNRVVGYRPRAATKADHIKYARVERAYTQTVRALLANGRATYDITYNDYGMMSHFTAKANEAAANLASREMVADPYNTRQVAGTWGPSWATSPGHSTFLGSAALNDPSFHNIRIGIGHEGIHNTPSERGSRGPNYLSAWPESHSRAYDAASDALQGGVPWF